MEESATNSLLQKSTRRRSKSSHSGFPGFKETPFSRKHLEEMNDFEILRLYRLYGYHVASKIYEHIGRVIKPGRFINDDFFFGERKRVVNKRISEAERASSTVSLHMANIRLILDVIKNKFPNLIEDEEVEDEF